MTRPAVNYNTPLQTPSTVSLYDIKGQFLSSSSTLVVSQRRRCSKDASVKTTPRKGGNYSTPTSYQSSGGHWSSTSSATLLLSTNPPPTQQYRVEWSNGCYADIGFDPRSLYSLPSSVQSELLVKALNRLRHSGVNLGVMLAEAGETASLFQTTARRIASSVRAFRRKRPTEFLQAVKHQGTASWRKTPQAWLELQYGWNPLMSDINGAISSLDSSWVRDRNIFAVGARKKLTGVSEYLLMTNPSYAQAFQSVDYEATMKIQLCYRLTNFTLALLSSLGLTNPVEIIWERVPYSFVVDWFLPVGNWLSALGGDFGYTFVNGSRTDFIRYSENGTPRRSAGGVAGYLAPIVGSAYYLRRSVFTSSPWPGLSFKSPVSSGHIANALSLLTQAFRRR